MALKRRKPIARRRRKPARKPRPAAPAPTELERAFETLQLELGADLVAVRAAYRRLVASCHPDKWAALGAGPRRVAEAHTREIIRAYEIVRAFLAAS